MNQLDQITHVIRQAVKESTNKNMSLQSAKALAAKIMGERNMHAAASAKAPVPGTDAHDRYTWHVVGHYDDNNQPFSLLARARDGFSALLEVADRARKEGDEDLKDTLILHSAINAFTGEVVYSSDDSVAGTYLCDLYSHLDAGFEPFSFSHAAHPQECELAVGPSGGYVVKVKPSEKDGRFLQIDCNNGHSTPFEQYEEARHTQAERNTLDDLQNELARIRSMGASEEDPIYTIRAWNTRPFQNDSATSYKEWVASKYLEKSGLDIDCVTVAFVRHILQQSSKEPGPLAREFARIDAMSAWDSDPVYPLEDWQREVYNMETTRSYKDWVKSQYEMNQHN